MFYLKYPTFGHNEGLFLFLLKNTFFPFSGNKLGAF